LSSADIDRLYHGRQPGAPIDGPFGIQFSHLVCTADKVDGYAHVRKFIGQVPQGFLNRTDDDRIKIFGISSLGNAAVTDILFEFSRF